MFTEDLSIWFADFGVPAALSGAPVQVIFDAEYSPGNVGAIGMAGSQPVATLPTAQVVGEAVGQQLVAAGNTYNVAAHTPDGRGISRLWLEGPL